jgi:hypothetical protein
MMYLSQARACNIARLLLLLTVGAMVYPNATQAVTFVVNDENFDIGDENPGDGVAMTVDGRTSLRAAIEEANALPGPDEIEVVPNSSNCCCFLIKKLEGTLFIEDDLRIYHSGPCFPFRGGPGLTYPPII